jgi:excisionase family DNA binding protein
MSESNASHGGDARTAGTETSQLEPYLTKTEIAKQLKVTARTIDDWMAKGLLLYLKIGRTVRFRRAVAA